MELNTSQSLYWAKIKRFEGDWYPVASFELALDDRHKGKRFLVDDAVVFAYSENGIFTIGTIGKDPAATFYGPHKARLVDPLITIRAEGKRELGEISRLQVELCETRFFKPGDHTVLVLGDLAVGIEAGQLAFGKDWVREES